MACQHCEALMQLCSLPACSEAGLSFTQHQRAGRQPASPRGSRQHPVGEDESVQRGLWAEPPQASEERWGSEKPARLPPEEQRCPRVSLEKSQHCSFRKRPLAVPLGLPPSPH